MKTYKIKSGIFLFAFVIAAVSYHLYEQGQSEYPLPITDNTVVDLQAEDFDDVDRSDRDEETEDPTP